MQLNRNSMNKKRNRGQCSPVHSRNTGILFYLLISCLLSILCLMTSAEAKVYIDIRSPGIRKLPISLHVSKSQAAKELTAIVKDDLEFTGLFSFFDPDVPGAEIIADIRVDSADGLRVILSVKDLIENREVLKKRFSASQLRPMAPSIPTMPLRLWPIGTTRIPGAVRPVALKAANPATAC